MHYYQFNIGDYARDTAHLTDTEDLAYRRMLDLYYRTESPLPLCIEEIARLIRMRSHSESIAIVLQDFFAKTKDGFVNARALAELEKTYSRSAKAKESAKARWSKNKDLGEKEDDASAMRSHSEGNADQMLHNTQYTIHNTQDIKDKPRAKKALDYSSWPSKPNDELFEEWKAMRRRMKANVTQVVINKTGRELSKAIEAGFTVDHCFEQWVYKGWRGFEAQWLKSEVKNGKTNNGFTSESGRKLSAHERIKLRNEQKYGTSTGGRGSGLGVGADGGSLRGSMVERERGDSAIDLDPSSFEARY